MHHNMILASLKQNHATLGLKGTKLYYDVSTARWHSGLSAHTVNVYQDADRRDFLGTFDLALFDKVASSVKCVNIRKSYPKQIIPGKTYYADTTSITTHTGGDKYAMIYHDELCQHLVARLNLNHFEDTHGLCHHDAERSKS